MGGWCDGSSTCIVQQCRNGQRIWSGGVTWWKNVNGGSTGDSHGRRTSGETPGQWQAGDLAANGACDLLPKVPNFVRVRRIDHIVGSVGQYFNFGLTKGWCGGSNTCSVQH